MFGEYTPLMPPQLLSKRLANGKGIIDPELGLQKWCPDCKEYWPQDTLFWGISIHKPDGLQSTCKASQLSKKRQQRNATKVIKMSELKKTIQEAIDATDTLAGRYEDGELYEVGNLIENVRDKLCAAIEIIAAGDDA